MTARTSSTSRLTASYVVAQLLAAGAPGRHPASAAVGLRLGAVTDVAADGWAQLPTGGTPGTPMQRSTMLDLASVTKVASTTVLAMLLTERGDLTLDERVAHYLPGFRGGAKDGVTVAQLLTHTAGLQPWWPIYFEATQRQDALIHVASMPLMAEPGTVCRYSDLGLILAGHVIEVVAGHDLDEAFRRMVAEPLGLRARYGPVAPESAAASADSDAYEYAMVATGDPYPVPFGPVDFHGWRATPLRGVVNDGNAAHALGGVSGHAGLFATIDDLLTLGTALQRGELVSRAVLEQFAAPTPLDPEQAVGFRLAHLDLGERRVRVLHHPGFTGTCYAVGLEEELVVAAGAMRLHGTLGPLSAVDRAPDRVGLLTGPAIEAVLFDAARTALLHSGSDPANPVEEA